MANKKETIDILKHLIVQIRENNIQGLGVCFVTPADIQISTFTTSELDLKDFIQAFAELGREMSGGTIDIEFDGENAS